MELYKLENGKPKKFKGGFVVYNNRIYTNPKEEVVRLTGYKDLVYGEKPEYNEETQYLNSVYTEDDNNIYVNYEVLDISVED
jgi:hypothetical protein